MVVVIPEGSLHFTDGKDLLKTFSEEGFSPRHFCTNCGSLVYGGGGAMTYVSAGALVDDPGLRPQFHIMVDHKAPWDEIHDDLPQFGEFPPAG